MRRGTTKVLFTGNHSGNVSLISGEKLSDWDLLIFGLGQDVSTGGYASLITTPELFKTNPLATQESSRNGNGVVSVHYSSDTVVHVNQNAATNSALRYIVGVRV